MIRTIITVITFLSFVGVLDAECVLAPPLESSSHVRISVVLAGKPLKGARIIFYRVSQHECHCAADVGRGNPMDTTEFSSNAFQTTDENGLSSLAELAPGEYEVAATIHGVASTSFVGLHVTSDPKVTTFPMDLTEQVQRVEKAPVLFHVDAFQGTVTDPLGAIIPGASIVVVKRETQAKDLALSEKADTSGHFSAQLAEGSYIAVFFFHGYRPAIVPFEVARGGASQLPVTLNVRACP